MSSSCGGVDRGRSARRAWAAVRWAMAVGALGCAEERPRPCPPPYGSVAVESIVGAPVSAGREAGATYVMSRSLAQGHEWGLRLSADAARTRTIRWEAQENVLIARDEGARNDAGVGAIVAAYRVLAWRDDCGETYLRRWYDRPLIEVDWGATLVDEPLIEDPRGAPVEAQTLRSTPAPGALFAPEVHCGERLCADPAPVGSRVSRIVVFASYWVDTDGGRRTVVVRTELTRAAP